jgi:hypothetical protein
MLADKGTGVNDGAGKVQSWWGPVDSIVTVLALVLSFVVRDAKMDSFSWYLSRRRLDRMVVDVLLA